MKITIDMDLCQGHGVCCSEAPGVFELDEAENKVRVLDVSPDASRRDEVDRAVKYCPTFALSVED